MVKKSIVVQLVEATKQGKKEKEGTHKDLFAWIVKNGLESTGAKK